MHSKNIFASALVVLTATAAPALAPSLRLLFSTHFLPHAYCYLAQPRLIWTNVAMDGLIAGAYFVLFVGLLWVAVRLRDLEELRAYLWVFVAFGSFIVACAATHVMEVVTIWWPAYWLSVAVKMVCAVASVTTAFLFTRALPTITRAFREFLDKLSILQAVLDSVDESIIVMDAAGVVVSANPAVNRMFEYREDEVVGCSLQSLVVGGNGCSDAEDRTDSQLAPQGNVTTGKRKATLRVPRDPQGMTKSGRLFPLEVAITEVSHSGQQLLVGLIRDITEHHRAQEELKRQAALLHLAHDAILLRDADDRIVFWNDGAQRMYGWTAEEAAGQMSRDLLQTEFTTPLPAIEAALSIKGEWEGELLQHTKAGVRLTVAARWSLQRGATESAEATMEINRDISARKRVEEALRESEQRFQMMVNGIPQLAWMAEADGYIFWYNQRWYDYTGKSLEQTQGWGWESVHDGEVLPLVLARWKEALVSGQPFHMEFPLRSATGELRTFLTRIVPFKNPAGEVMRWFGTHTDITERKQAEDLLSEQTLELYRQAEQLLGSQQALEAQRYQLAKRTTQLELVNGELEAFTYTVSHDLRAPLRQIVGFASILREDFGPEIPPAAENTLRRIAAAARRAGFMVDGMLSLARLGRQSLKLRYVDLNALVEQVLPLLRAEWEGREVEWRIAQLPALRCDPILISQVFQNLLSNAIKYSRKQAVALIEVDSYQEPGQPPVIFVRDNGAGFNMQYADRLFGMFQRLHEESEFEGSGVGLATVRSIVQKHGGAVWAESEMDRGSTFYFTLDEGEHARRVVEPFAQDT